MRFETLRLLDLVLLLVENCQYEWNIGFNSAMAVLQHGSAVSGKATAVKAFAFKKFIFDQ